jgi:hypothetical protein
MNMAILAVALITLGNCVKEFNFVVLNHSLVGVPKQCVCLTIVKARVFFWRGTLRHEKCYFLFRVRYHVLRSVNTSRRGKVLVRHHLFPFFSRDSKSVIWWDVVTASFTLLFSILTMSLRSWCHWLLGGFTLF